MSPEVFARILENVTNCPVVQLPNRQFPGVVLQGDTLYSFYRNAQRALQAIDADTNTDAHGACEFLVDSLAGILAVYEETLSRSDIELPYFREE